MYDSSCFTDRAPTDSVGAKDAGLPTNVVSLDALSGAAAAVRRAGVEDEWQQLRAAEVALVRVEVHQREHAFDTLVALSRSRNPFVVMRACTLLRGLGCRDLRFDDRAGAAIQAAADAASSRTLADWLWRL